MEIAKEDLKRINDYDYNKMIEDFQLRDSMVKERKKRLKHLVEVNKNYSSRVDTMKETVRSAEFEKIQKCKREIEMHSMYLAVMFFGGFSPFFGNCLAV